jgi:hypothetical protein
MVVEDRECLTCGESIERQHPSEIDEELFVCRILLTLAHSSIKRFSCDSMSYMYRIAMKGGHTNHFGRFILPSRESPRKCVVDSINPHPLLPDLLQKCFVEIAQRKQRLDYVCVTFRTWGGDDPPYARGRILYQGKTEDFQCGPR